eukprot:979940-Heterocapsa_arctica.AAC.1
MKASLAFCALVAVVVGAIAERSCVPLAFHAILRWCSRVGPFSGVVVAVVVFAVTCIGLPTCPIYVGAG